MTGYIEGPTLAHDEPPWPLLWEQDSSIDDGHAHEWERCLLLAGTGRHRTEHVVRCRHCHAPRCGHSGDEDPCMERRHHDSLHIYLSGRFEPLGGWCGCAGCDPREDCACPSCREVELTHE